MKKYTIWLITGLTGTVLVALLYLQALYFKEVVEICTEQFDLQAGRSLRKVARDLEHDLEANPIYADLNIFERVNGAELDGALTQALHNNGIDLDYHFAVVSTDGREVYHCDDYEEPGYQAIYQEILFLHSPRAQMGVLKVHFPERQRYILETMNYMIPVVVLTFVLLVMFILTIWTALRQKRLSEIKNDFINNMTHELKTPISSISLAAQMLSDTSMPKTEKSMARLTGVIVDETRRLRYLVDKVLQMSMFDRHEARTFKMEDVDVNTLVNDVVGTFRLKVENNGGTLTANLDATEAIVRADEMHLTNVIFNLLDNAVKYRSEERPLALSVTTHCDDDMLIVTVSDNGIGIRHDDLRKVFERFYRVGTGNVHNVKGFGLGLAYVQNVVQTLKGTIHAESTYGEGTSFIIKLPLIK